MEFMSKEQWDEIYDNARKNGYAVNNFLVVTMRRALRYPGHEPSDSQVLLKLALLEEDTIYKLCTSKELWP